MRVTVTSTLQAPIGAVWEKLKQTETLRFVTEGVMTYYTIDLPTEWEVGKTINLRPRLWGKPQGDHFVTVISRSDDEHKIVTHEKGGSVTKWNHTMQLLEDYPGECRLVDTIDIEAGWQTLLIWFFAQNFYHHRHRRWQQLITTP